MVALDDLVGDAGVGPAQIVGVEHTRPELSPSDPPVGASRDSLHGPADRSLIRTLPTGEALAMSIDTALEPATSTRGTATRRRQVVARADRRRRPTRTRRPAGRSRATRSTANVAGVYAGFPDVRFETVVRRHHRRRPPHAAQWRMLGTNTGSAPRRSRDRRFARPPRRRLLHLRPHRRQGEQRGRRTSTPPPCSASSGCRPTSHPPTPTASPSSASASGWRPAATRCPGAFTVTWIEVDPEHQGDAHRGRHQRRAGAARQRGLPRRLLRHRRPPQLHLHRLDQPRGRAAGTPRATRTRAR